jgi:wyosine [tRNA(Phe)-imidazoG37] synthetase (radical SAM superfamily)
LRKAYRPFADCRKSEGCPLSWISIVYGPFESRRRGRSLGINLFPVKSVCNFNCVYCFRGGAQIKACSPTLGPLRISAADVVNALKEALTEVRDVKAIDFSGNGEPTLHLKFKEIVWSVRSFIREAGLDVSLGTFTNSTLLHRREVIEALQHLDHVEAKLDTVIDWKLKAINRPCRGITVQRILENLIGLRRMFDGTLAIQIILIKYHGIKNYTPRDAKLMAESLAKIEPDVVNVYTAYRRPRLESVKPAPREEMEVFSEILKEHGLNVKVFYE